MAEKVLNQLTQDFTEYMNGIKKYEKASKKLTSFVEEERKRRNDQIRITRTNAPFELPAARRLTVANARATVERTGYAEVEKYLDEREKQKADREIRAARRTFTAQIREMSKEMMDQFDEARLHLSQHVDKQISDIDSMLELLHIVKEN